MTTLYICRHGETENNRRKRLMGWIDTPLTEEGIQNAHSAARKLLGIDFDAIYASDLGRAFMTAYLVAIDNKYSTEIRANPGLREVNYGDYANLPYGKIPASAALSSVDFRPPHGETLAEMQQRVLTTVTTISRKHNGETVLLVSHDGPINALYAAFKGLDLGEIMKDQVNPHDFVAQLETMNGKINSFAELRAG